MCWQSNFRGNEPINVEPPLVGEGCFEGLVSESRLLDEHDDVSKASQPIS